jgi:hypothetical protein
LSPSNFAYYYGAIVRLVNSSGSLGNSYYVYGSYGVRPSVVLKRGTEYSSGDGSMSNPYIIDTGD